MESIKCYYFPTPSFDTIFEKLYEYSERLKDQATSFVVIMDNHRYTDAALDVMITDKVIRSTVIYHNTHGISLTLTNGVFIYITTFDTLDSNQIQTSDHIVFIALKENEKREETDKSSTEDNR